MNTHSSYLAAIIHLVYDEGYTIQFPRFRDVDVLGVTISFNEWYISSVCGLMCGTMYQISYGFPFNSVMWIILLNNKCLLTKSNWTRGLSSISIQWNTIHLSIGCIYNTNRIRFSILMDHIRTHHTCAGI